MKRAAVLRSTIWFVCAVTSAFSSPSALALPPCREEPSPAFAASTGMKAAMQRGLLSSPQLAKWLPSRVEPNLLKGFSSQLEINEPQQSSGPYIHNSSTQKFKRQQFIDYVEKPGLVRQSEFVTYRWPSSPFTESEVRWSQEKFGTQYTAPLLEKAIAETYVSVKLRQVNITSGIATNPVLQSGTVPFDWAATNRQQLTGIADVLETWKAERSARQLEAQKAFERLKRAVPEDKLIGQLGYPSVGKTAEPVPMEKMLELIELDRRSQLFATAVERNRGQTKQVAFKRRRELESGGAGTPSDPKDPVLPGTGPVVQGTNGGVVCAKAASAAERTKHDSIGRSVLLTHPFGFNEVGRMVVKHANGNENLCSFVLLSGRLAVTALHCVAEPILGRAMVFGGEAHRPKSQHVAHRPNTIFELLVRQCPNGQDRPPCAFRPLALASIQVIDDRWNPAQGTPDVDLALLHLQPFDTKGSSFAEVAWNEPTQGPVTTVGWGITESARPEQAGDTSLVGWHRGKLERRRVGTLGLSWANDLSGTIPCGGDSGGALYVDEIYGRSTERPYRVVGILSGIATRPQDRRALPPRSDSIEHCKAGEAVYTALPAFKAALCDAQRSLKGC